MGTIKRIDKAEVFCSFCERPNKEVAMVIAGKYSNICSDCVSVCVKTIADKANQSTAEEPEGRTFNLPSGLKYQAINECEIALIRLLLEDSKELQKLKPNAKSDQNIRLAESMLSNQAAVKRGYYTSKSLCETDN